MGYLFQSCADFLDLQAQIQDFVFLKYLRFRLRLSLSLNGRMVIRWQNSRQITIQLFQKSRLNGQMPNSSANETWGIQNAQDFT